ncbi:Cyanohydrin beta-glucosyltransferase [Dichanthelium oligosanthes]|uniref:Glycosyltransferase n=1 Tax=Dichanthelium oligosanthes TaxID=888268 RepID=A0A1E5UX76_9POAL|nr:Cyanohydrin beta-glucosyltransferase [Dichanthelium oligosanthes]
MGSSTAAAQANKPHVVLVPFPAHGHVAPHVQLARVLRARGAHVTIVHTELHHRRLLQARGGGGGEAPAADDEGGQIAVEVIPDELSLEDPPRTLQAHHEAMERNCLEPFKALLRELAGRPGAPPVSCVVADTPMPFAAVAAREVGVPDVQFFTASACGLMGYLQFQELLAREIIPLKGIRTDYKSDGSLDTPLEWVPGMKGMRLRDMPTFCRTTDADDWLLHFHVHQMRTAAASKAVILNTFYDMEKDVVDALAPLLPPVYTVGPLASVIASLPESGGGGGGDTASGGGISLLQEDEECMAWLDGKAPRSVVYLSFGSHASMGGARLQEFAAGLARCGTPYLWVLRPEMAAEVEAVGGDDGLVVPWCAQEAVLSHPAVGLFVTHCGWNSILESVVAGVPVLGCPVLSEQTTNCRQVCTARGIGGELPQEAGSEEIAALVREMMAGRKGKEARDKTLEWKRLAEASAKEGGSSYENIGRLVENVLLKGI